MHEEYSCCPVCLCVHFPFSAFSCFSHPTEGISSYTRVQDYLLRLIFGMHVPYKKFIFQEKYSGSISDNVDNTNWKNSCTELKSRLLNLAVVIKGSRGIQYYMTFYMQNCISLYTLDVLFKNLRLLVLVLSNYIIKLCSN